MCGSAKLASWPVGRRLASSRNIPGPRTGSGPAGPRARGGAHAPPLVIIYPTAGRAPSAPIYVAVGYYPSAILLLQGRAGLVWVSFPPLLTSPPSQPSPQPGVRDRQRRWTCWLTRLSPTGGRRALSPRQAHPGRSCSRTTLQHNCIPRAHSIRPPHYPQGVVRKILALEFVEMSELRADVWPEDPTPADTQNTSRRAGRPPVISIKTWLECFARLAAVLVSRFPEKGPELWAYQSTILNAAHSYEGATWVAYGRQFRREMLARKDLNWSIPNSRLYNEAFTGRAKMMQRCQYCLSEDHGSTGCPQHPNPMILGWFQPTGALPQPSALTSVAPSLPSTSARPPGTEICRNFNAGRCNFSRCRYSHVCVDCAGPHSALSCPRRAAALGPLRNRQSQRPHGNPGGRGTQFHPYAPPPQHPGPSTS